jgi:hypothetical protein
MTPESRNSAVRESPPRRSLPGNGSVITSSHSRVSAGCDYLLTTVGRLGKLLLVLAGTVILGLECHGTHDSIYCLTIKYLTIFRGLFTFMYFSTILSTSLSVSLSQNLLLTIW